MPEILRKKWSQISPLYFYVGVGPEVTTMQQPALEQFPLEERILVVLAQQPWASAPDLAQRPDLPDSDIRDDCATSWRRTK